MSTSLTIPVTGEVLERNPARLGFPPMLPFELAMRTGTPKDVCDAYGITRAEFVDLCATEAFIKAFAAAVEEVKRDGASFRLKARLQAEALLAKSWTMIHDDSTPNTIKADLIKSTIRWAGYEPKNGEVNSTANAFQININLDRT